MRWAERHLWILIEYGMIHRKKAYFKISYLNLNVSDLRINIIENYDSVDNS